MLLLPCAVKKFSVGVDYFHTRPFCVEDTGDMNVIIRPGLDAELFLRRT